jgi:hypothetical protein
VPGVDKCSLLSIGLSFHSNFMSSTLVILPHTRISTADTPVLLSILSMFSSYCDTEHNRITCT